MSATATPAMDESTLIRRIRDGEGRLFRQLVDRHLGAVYNLIYRMTGNADTSEELTQETFVRAYQYLHRFDASRPLKPWLLRIASNVTVTHLRKTSRVVSLTELEESGQWEEAQFGQTDADSQPLSRMEHRL